MKEICVVVLPHPHLSEAEEARVQLREAAETLHEQAAQALADGMRYSRQSARVEQLAEHTSDEHAIYARDLFVKEGLINVATTTNASGGQA